MARACGAHQGEATANWMSRLWACMDPGASLKCRAPCIRRSCVSDTQRLSRRATVILVLVWAWIIGTLIWRALVYPLMSPEADYLKHWQAAHAILAGESPYIGELFLGFNYPMFTGFLFLHLAAFTPQGGQDVWEVGNFVFVILGALVLAWGLRPASIPEYGGDLVQKLRHVVSRHWLTVVFLIIANYQPLHTVLLASNVEPLNVLLGGLFTAFLVRRNDRAAGVFLAFFALVKLAPIMMLIPLAAVRRWRVLLYAVFTFAMYGMFLAVTGLWKTELYLYTDVVPMLGYYWQGISMSVHRFIASAFFPDLQTDPEGYAHMVKIVNFSLLAIYLALAAWWWRLPNRCAESFVAFGFYMMLLFAPLMEVNHFVWIIGGIFLQLYAWRERLMPDWAVALCAVGWACVMAIRLLNELPFLFGLNITPFWIPCLATVLATAVSGVAAFARIPAAQDAHAAARMHSQGFAEATSA